jgi:hypothetical protein
MGAGSSTINLQFQAQADTAYTLQSGIHPSEGPWVTLTNFPLSPVAVSRSFLDHHTKANPMRFYRVVSSPSN